MTTEQQNQNAGSGNRDDDEYSSVIDMLRAAASDDNIPDEVKNLDGGDATSKGPASHKFAEQQKRLKTAVSLIEQQREKLKGAGSKETPALSEAAPPDNRSNQDEAIFNALSMQALQNLGITKREEAPHSFDLEVNRLWSDNASRLERQRGAKEDAPAFVANELTKYEQLDATDIDSLKQRLGKRDVLSQIDPKVIRREVASYLGEKALTGQSDGGGNGIEDDSSVGAAGDGSPPVGPVKNHGSSGVRPGSGAPRKRDEPKPVSAEERAEMKKLGFQDVAAYRAAKNKTSKYRNR